MNPPVINRYCIIAETFSFDGNAWHLAKPHPWHRDPFHRVTVVLSGDLLNIEFRDGGKTLSCQVTAGEVDWSEPSDRIHRAVNVGKQLFEEVVTFFLDRSDAVPQPPDDSE